MAITKNANRIEVRLGILFCLALILLSCQSQEAAKPIPLTSFDAQAKEILAQMTLEEKIGQMIQTENANIKDSTDIQTYFLGSVLSGGSADPEPGNSLEAWTDLYDSYQKMAMGTRLGIPILYGIDAVHGHNNVLGAVIFPHNIGLGATRNPDLVKEISRITAVEVRATGINWTFAPCVTVPRDDRWGRTYEGFAETPEIASKLGEAAVLGYQGTDLSNPLSIAACAKHYVGDGGTSAAPRKPHPRFPNASGIKLDQGDTQLDEQTLRDIHLFPYKAAIEAGVATIMPSYSSWNGLKCSANKYLLTDVLKGEMGFEGFLISDYRAIDQVHEDYKTAIGISINAGMDMGMVPDKYKEFFQFLKELVEEDVVPMSRIDDAVTRILRVKIALGLLDEDRSPLADRTLHQKFGSPEHRAVARDAVRQSLVLLKNENNTLPISKSEGRIHVAGSGADNLGKQCGGWTIAWLGEEGEVTEDGTTILTALKDGASENCEITYSEDGSDADGADVGIVVIGEKPYAEGIGDRDNLSLSEKDMATFKAMKAAGIPVTVVLLSGRPMIINDIIDEADAFVAAWLPGTEGAGVADVLYGDYKPTGKLSFSWPRSMEQVVVNHGDTEYDPLFEFGYGLTY